MKRITRVFHEWGNYRLPFQISSGYSTTNMIHRIKELRVNIESKPSSKILCHDPKECNRDYCTAEKPCRFCRDLKLFFKIDVEWAKLPKLQKGCVFAKYGLTKIIGEDGDLVTAKQASKILNVPWGDFQSSWQRGVREINIKVGI